MADRRDSYPTHDEFVGNRLPDLPNDGYSTRREKQVSDAIMMLIRELERNRPYLLTVVCEGPQVFRKRMMKAYRYLKMDRQAADAIFRYLVLLAGPNPETQLETLKDIQANPRAYLFPTVQ